MDSKYCYPNTNVLINKLGIRNQDKLCAIESKLTMLRIMELIDHPISGKFDFAHLKAIHKYIFQDLYEWAGEIRTVNIAKKDMFCDIRFIENQAQEIFNQLQRDIYRDYLDIEDFVDKLAYYISEINALHPFREGNGRAQREFIRTLAMKNGYAIHFDRISKNEMIIASQKSFLLDYSDMKRLIRKCLN